jgi:hypothetical protein
MNFDELPARQAGRFTRGQARSGGFSAYRISRRIESGEWRVVRGRVLALCAVPDSLEPREWEAILSAGSGATFAGPSAARRHSFEISDARPCILVPPSRRAELPDGAVLLRRELPDRDTVVRDDYLLTGRECTVIDCALLLDERTAMQFVERALQKSWISYDELTLRVQRAVGRRGVEQLVTIVRALGSGAHSDTERRLVTGLRRQGCSDGHATSRSRTEAVLSGSSISPSRRSSSPSSWTGARGTLTAVGSSTTALVRIAWLQPGGRFCASPGRTSDFGWTTSSPTSAPPSRERATVDREFR